MSFLFGPHSITEAQALSVAYPTKIKAKGDTPEHWILRYFSADKARKVAEGRVGQPRDKKSYLAREQAKHEDGSLYPADTPKAVILRLCKSRTQEEVTRAKWEIEDRSVELWQKCKKDKIADRWSEWRDQDTDGQEISKKTVEAYERYLSFILSKHNLDVLADIQDKVFSKFKDRNSNLVQDKKPYVGEKYAARTLRSIERAFLRFLEWGKEEGILDPRLYLGSTKLRKITGPKRRNNATPFKDERDLGSFLAYVRSTPVSIASSDRMRDLWSHRFKLMAHTGLRSDEALHLKWGDIHLEEDPYIWITEELSKTSEARRIGLLAEGDSPSKGTRPGARRRRWGDESRSRSVAEGSRGCEAAPETWKRVAEIFTGLL